MGAHICSFNVNFHWTIRGGTMDTTLRERRKKPRLIPIKNVLSVNEVILAEIIDINNCGISCRGLMTNGKTLPKITTLGLLNCQSGIFVENLPCRTVRTIHETIDNRTFVKFSMEFQNLIPSQLIILDRFIKNT
jgi:hypothetical protein